MSKFLLASTNHMRQTKSYFWYETYAANPTYN